MTAARGAGRRRTDRWSPCHTEVERKYVADDGFELPPLTELMAGTDGRRDREIAPVVEGEPVRQRLAATYFDTADLRLAAAGLTLRRRTGGEDAGWHLKVPAGRMPARRCGCRWGGPPGRCPRTAADGVGTQPRLRAAPGRRDRDRPDGAPAGRRDRTRRGGGGRRPRHGPQVAAHGRPGGRGGVPRPRGARSRSSSTTGTVDLLSAVDARLREHGLSEAPSASKLARVLDVQPSDAADRARAGS